MKASENLIQLGIILLFMGFGILLLTSPTEGQTFFFVFPFFFFGELTGIGFVISLAIIGIMIWYFVAGFPKSISRQGRLENERIYLEVEGICDYCGSAIPTGASFCQVCGRSIRNERESW
ncbi:MAG: hypothetical protein BAJATHORv1_10189 [Candidatus Thorarchaeota archaeon]|nr:MAG: hypothetical protein BAJATHORv1_10189 [Candidatus Thorarchaeota archaeon]